MSGIWRFLGWLNMAARLGESLLAVQKKAPWHLRLWGEYMSAPWICVYEDKLKPEDKDRPQQLRKLVPEARFEVVHGSAKLRQ